MSRRVRQSGIRYLVTEEDIARDLCVAVPAPIRLFDLAAFAHLGLDRARFLGDLAQSFERLAWDTYDVKREQVAFLLRHFPDAREELLDFRARYYADTSEERVTLRELAPYFRRLPYDAKRLFERVRSYRRRSIAQFTVTKADSEIYHDEWHVLRTKCFGFRQHVVGDDPRSLERIFDPTADDLVRHRDFQALLIAVAELVEDAEVDAGRAVTGMTLTFHQMGLVTYGGAHATNAPEGMHRDGADYIVSALVVHRDDIVGAESIVYCPDGRTPYLRVTLGVGQGIFQADCHRDLPPEQWLWHDITPVELCAESVDGVGMRDIFGFDVTLHRSV